MSQIGNLPQVAVNITNIWNHHLVLFCSDWFHPAIQELSWCSHPKNEKWTTVLLLYTISIACHPFHLLASVSENWLLQYVTQPRAVSRAYLQFWCVDIHWQLGSQIFWKGNTSIYLESITSLSFVSVLSWTPPLATRTRKECKLHFSLNKASRRPFFLIVLEALHCNRVS